jgi:hypothetical protein
VTVTNQMMFVRGALAQWMWKEALLDSEWDRATLPYQNEEPRTGCSSPTVEYDVAYEDAVRVIVRAGSMPEPAEHWNRWGQRTYMQQGPEIGMHSEWSGRAPMPYDLILDALDAEAKALRWRRSEQLAEYEVWN